MKPPAPTPPPRRAWSKNPGRFHPKSHFCSHCGQEIPPGGKMWFKHNLVLCTESMQVLFPQYRN